VLDFHFLRRRRSEDLDAHPDRRHARRIVRRPNHHHVAGSVKLGNALLVHHRPYFLRVQQLTQAGQCLDEAGASKFGDLLRQRRLFCRDLLLELPHIVGDPRHDGSGVDDAAKGLCLFLAPLRKRSPRKRFVPVVRFP